MFTIDGVRVELDAETLKYRNLRRGETSRRSSDRHGVYSAWFHVLDGGSLRGYQCGYLEVSSQPRGGAEDSEGWDIVRGFVQLATAKHERGVAATRQRINRFPAMGEPGYEIEVAPMPASWKSGVMMPVNDAFGPRGVLSVLRQGLQRRQEAEDANGA